jgi:hypothetical protein
LMPPLDEVIGWRSRITSATTTHKAEEGREDRARASS